LPTLADGYNFWGDPLFKERTLLLVPDNIFVVPVPVLAKPVSKVVEKYLEVPAIIWISTEKLPLVPSDESSFFRFLMWGFLGHVCGVSLMQYARQCNTH
jgi:hypothetical protein